MRCVCRRTHMKIRLKRTNAHERWELLRSRRSCTGIVWGSSAHVELRAVSTLASAFASEVKCMRMEFYLICHGFSILHLIRTTMNEIQVTPINFILLDFFRFQFDSDNATHFIHVQMRKSSVHGRFLCCDDLSLHCRRCQSVFLSAQNDDRSRWTHERCHFRHQKLLSLVRHFVYIEIVSCVVVILLSIGFDFDTQHPYTQLMPNKTEMSIQYSYSLIKLNGNCKIVSARNNNGEMRSQRNRCKDFPPLSATYLINRRQTVNNGSNCPEAITNSIQIDRDQNTHGFFYNDKLRFTSHKEIDDRWRERGRDRRGSELGDSGNCVWNAQMNHVVTELLL